MGTITLLGTGDSLGVPRVYCNCSVCEEARTTGVNRRLRSSLLIEDGGERLLIDCGPDWPLQMEQANLREVNKIFITHAHHDHIGGLPQWADSLRWLGTRGTVYAACEVIDRCLAIYDWLPGTIDFMPADKGASWRGWLITPWKVCHGKNGHAYAFRFEKESYKWAYCPDSIALSDEQKQPLEGLDLLILGTSYYKEEFEFATRSVYDMCEASELIAAVKPGITWFTHMSHGIDLNEFYALPDNALPAKPRMRIAIP